MLKFQTKRPIGDRLVSEFEARKRVRGPSCANAYFNIRFRALALSEDSAVWLELLTAAERIDPKKARLLCALLPESTGKRTGMDLKELGKALFDAGFSQGQIFTLATRACGDWLEVGRLLKAARIYEGAAVEIMIERKMNKTLVGKVLLGAGLTLPEMIDAIQAGARAFLENDAGARQRMEREGFGREDVWFAYEVLVVSLVSWAFTGARATSVQAINALIEKGLTGYVPPILDGMGFSYHEFILRN